MTTEQRFLITALSDHLSSRMSYPPEDLNWQELFILSELHQVSGIIFAQCKDARFQKAYYLSLSHYIKRKKAVEIIEETLQKNRIDYFLVKGPVVAQYYPILALRTMGDVDIVVHSGEREIVRDLLIHLGFRFESEAGKKEWHFHYGKLAFELHDRLVYEQAISLNKHKEFFNDCWKYVKDGVVDPNFHFLFLLLHLRKHFMNSGVGFRQFMDVAVMEKQNLNWLWIEKKLKELDLWVFAETVFALNEVWFGIVSPLSVKAIDQGFVDEATEMILTNGVFGFDNEQNKHNIAVNIARSDGSSVVAGLKYLLRVIFPPSSDLIVKPQFYYVKGRKYLLPLAWVHRAVRSVHLQRAVAVMRKEIQHAFTTNNVIEERSNLLNKWGL